MVVPVPHTHPESPSETQKDLLSEHQGARATNVTTRPVPQPRPLQQTRRLHPGPCLWGAAWAVLLPRPATCPLPPAPRVPSVFLRDRIRGSFPVPYPFSPHPTWGSLEL